MTQEDQDAVVGRLMRERTDAERNEAALRAECDKLGRQLQDAGRALQTRPENVVFTGQSHSGDFQWQRGGALITPGSINDTRILQLTNDLRETLTKLTEIRRQLGAFGIR
ncbi:MAG: hypothetical protein WA188_05775 [Terriglobales bacterium]